MARARSERRRAERDHLDAEDFAGGDDVPEAARDDVGGEEVEVAGAIRLLVAGHAAHGGYMIDAVGGAHGDGFDLHAGESLAATFQPQHAPVFLVLSARSGWRTLGAPVRFNDEIVGGGVAIGLGADESAAQAFGDE